MTDDQYTVVDELYFVTDFSVLRHAVPFSEEKLLNVLEQLLQNEWVKLLNNEADVEIPYDPSIFRQNFDSYYYLATKKGLFEHNSQ